jgi:hypothetical protein
VATTIVHALQDFHHTGQKAPADWLRALAESAESDVALLEGIEGALPEHTLELRELAMRATGALLNRLADLPSVNWAGGRRPWPPPRKPCASAANWRPRARTPSCPTWPCR